jgi:hypothetical protein
LTYISTDNNFQLEKIIMKAIKITATLQITYLPGRRVPKGDALEPFGYTAKEVGEYLQKDIQLAIDNGLLTNRVFATVDDYNLHVYAYEADVQEVE